MNWALLGLSIHILALIISIAVIICVLFRTQRSSHRDSCANHYQSDSSIDSSAHQHHGFHQSQHSNHYHGHGSFGGGGASDSWSDSSGGGNDSGGGSND